MQQIFDVETFKAIYPKEFSHKLFEKGLRVDGRSFEQLRETSGCVGSISSALSSCLLRFGNTTVLCGIKAEIAKPTLQEPNKGFIVPNLTYSAMASSKISNNSAPSDLAQSQSEVLDGIMKLEKVFDRRQLCIVPDKAVWCVYAEIVCMNDDGGVLDAALTALSIALGKVILPSVMYDEDDEMVYLTNDQSPVSLACLPIYGISFGNVDNHLSAPIMDLTCDEEQVVRDRYFLVVSGNGDLLYIKKTGPGDISISAVKKAKSLAIRPLNVR